jgi:UDP-glucose 4-epimerase
MDALVTGGAGFIGGHLVDDLRTEHAVRVLDSDPEAKAPADTTYIEADVRDEVAVSRAVADADVVFHEAALVSVDASVADPKRSHTTNATGTLNVLEAAREHDTRVVLASSAAVYGHPEGTPISEAHPKEPTSPYGLDKLAADHYARLYADRYDLDTVALRYFNVYGPRQTGEYAGVITVFIEQALADDPITVHGDGSQTRDFVFVEDVVRANRLAAETGQAGTAYNVGTGASITIRDLAELIRDITDANSDIVHTDPREGDIEQSKADISKAESALGYEPRVSLREGLERTVERFREERK